jgi:hypothetical protein
MKIKNVWWTLSIISAILVTMLTSCAQHPSLVIENTSPPRFVFSGSGSVTHLQVTGPDLEPVLSREGSGDRSAPKVYWEVASSPGRPMNEMRSVTYGTVPDGFIQIQPQNGGPPPRLVEQQLYNFRLSVTDGDGFNNFFVIRDGKIVSESDR